MRSIGRLEYLIVFELARGGPMNPTGLYQAMEGSDLGIRKSNMDRSLRNLEIKGWVVKRGNKYETTSEGESVGEAYWKRVG